MGRRQRTGASGGHVLLAGFLCAAPAAAQQQGVNVTGYAFDLFLPNSGDTITAEALVHVVRGSTAGDTLCLNLNGMEVDTVSWLDYRQPEIPGGLAVSFRYDGRSLCFPFEKRVARPEDRVETAFIRYRGKPKDGLFIGTDSRGRRVVFGDNWPDRARYWLPVIDHPTDKAQVSFHVFSREKWKVVSNGAAASTQQDRFWIESKPIPTYTMVIGAAYFTISHHPATRSQVPIEIWTYPEDSAYADSVPFRRATEIVETMERLVGPFPYEKLAHVESSTRYGGMENSSAIFYAEKPYVDRTMREGVVRHETAHQWFGDAVTAREWPHLWLSEGFASYFDLVIGAALDGDSVLTEGMRRNAESYFRSSVVDRPVVDTAEHDPNRLLNANNYQKGAWVLHMLRRLVGDSTFFRGIRDFYRVYRDSTAVSEDFQQVMEQAAAGRRLGWFFRQWLRQPGYPQLTVQWRYEPADRRVRLDLTQVQPEAWGGFRLPRVEVEAVTAGAKRVRRVFSMDARTIIAYLELDKAPVEVRVDPDDRLLLQVTPGSQ